LDLILVQETGKSG